MYGTAAPHIPHPSDKQWSHISLPWMSVGYEVQIPPIYTLTFYNAIANGGKMVRPIFVKAISSNGKIIKTFETETVRSQICSKETLEQIKKALLGVVHDKQFGTAKAAQSNLISISGKTGTAQISKGAAGYKAGGKEHQVSFCGYFPSENPQYTCIVVLRKPQGVPSGGTMAGAVVKKIAEEVMAMNMQKTPQEMISDSLFIAANWLKMPKIKNGNFPALKNLTKILHFSLDGEGEKWTVSKTDSNKIEVMPLKLINNLVPNVEGMGARDAVYLMENSGLQVLLSGRGKVFHQSIPPGTRAVKGAIVTLSLGSQNLR
jgi:cell division protein FtsI (penicillin-binding protein 3)